MPPPLLKGNLLLAICSSEKIAEDGTVTPRTTLVHVVPAGPQKGGRFAVEWVAGLAWNQWPDCRGIDGRFGVELVATLPGNTHMKFGFPWRHIFLSNTGIPTLIKWGIPCSNSKLSLLARILWHCIMPAHVWNPGNGFFYIVWNRAISHRITHKSLGFLA